MNIGFIGTGNMGGAMIDGTYTHLQSQFGHNAGHDVVLPQLNADCGGVKSIVFQLFAQDDGVATGTTFMYLDNISVSNADESSEPETPTILTYSEDFGAVTDALKAGDKIQLVGFGTFEVRERAEKQARNPRTGETMTVPASKVPTFKAGKALKDAIK